MIRFPLMTKPVPEERRTESNRHGASHTGCWLKLEIWITERSGEAPKTAAVPSRSRTGIILSTKVKMSVGHHLVKRLKPFSTALRGRAYLLIRSHIDDGRTGAFAEFCRADARRLTLPGWHAPGRKRSEPPHVGCYGLSGGTREMRQPEVAVLSDAPK